MNTPQLSIIVPMYNEEENLTELHERLTKVLGRTDPSGEIIYVDDGSTDSTGQLLEDLLQGDQPVCVRAVRLPRRRGKTAALSAGFAIARGTVFVTTDADMQEPPEVLPMVLSPVQSGIAQMAVAWRQQRQDSPPRILASRLFNGIVRCLTGLNLHDINCGTKAMRREVAEGLADWMFSDMHRYLPVLAARMGYRVVEVPVPHVARRRGRSRFGAGRYLRALVDILPVSLLWGRGWLAWLALTGASSILGVKHSLVGALGFAVAAVWLGVALFFYLRKDRT